MTKITRRMGKLKAFEVRELSRDELTRLHEPRAKLPSLQRIRDSHHQLARLFASGLRIREVSERSGYSVSYITKIYPDPAFQELIAQKRAVVDEAWRESQDEYQELLLRNMIAAERHIADRIDECDETGELLPVKTAIAISRDAADRMGYGKKQTNLNVNVDFAKNLEAMLRRSGKSGAPLTSVIPGAPLPPPTRSPSIESLAPQHSDRPPESEAGAAPMRRIA